MSLIFVNGDLVELLGLSTRVNDDFIPLAQFTNKEGNLSAFRTFSSITCSITTI